jgi:hypothetical protein
MSTLTDRLNALREELNNERAKNLKAGTEIDSLGDQVFVLTEELKAKAEISSATASQPSESSEMAELRKKVEGQAEELQKSEIDFNKVTQYAKRFQEIIKQLRREKVKLEQEKAQLETNNAHMHQLQQLTLDLLTETVKYNEQYNERKPIKSVDDIQGVLADRMNQALDEGNEDQIAKAVQQIDLASESAQLNHSEVESAFGRTPESSKPRTSGLPSTSDPLPPSNQGRTPSIDQGVQGSSDPQQPQGSFIPQGSWLSENSRMSNRPKFPPGAKLGQGDTGTWASVPYGGRQQASAFYAPKTRSYDDAGWGYYDPLANRKDTWRGEEDEGDEVQTPSFNPAEAFMKSSQSALNPQVSWYGDHPKFPRQKSPPAQTWDQPFIRSDDSGLPPLYADSQKPRVKLPPSLVPLASTDSKVEDVPTQKSLESPTHPEKQEDNTSVEPIAEGPSSVEKEMEGNTLGKEEQSEPATIDTVSPTPKDKATTETEASLKEGETNRVLKPKDPQEPLELGLGGGKKGTRRRKEEGK